MDIRRLSLWLCSPLFLQFQLLLQRPSHGFGVEVGLIPGAKQFFAGVASSVLSKVLFFISEGLFGCGARLAIEQACSKRARRSEPAPAHAARKTKWTRFFPQPCFGRRLALARSRRHRERFEVLRCHCGDGLLLCQRLPAESDPLIQVGPGSPDNAHSRRYVPSRNSILREATNARDKPRAFLYRDKSRAGAQRRRLPGRLANGG